MRQAARGDGLFSATGDDRRAVDAAGIDDLTAEDLRDGGNAVVIQRAARCDLVVARQAPLGDVSFPPAPMYDALSTPPDSTYSAPPFKITVTEVTP